jgi:predicted DNA-binding transcriptional regulator AlpA
MKSYSLDAWCEMHGFSRAYFYLLDRRGHAPRSFKVGRCRRISEEANNEWIAAREAANSTAAA